MKKEVELLKKSRVHLFELIKELTPEQLNEIPNGFNNNIIWNLGHLFTVQQSICYLRAGIDTLIDSKSFSDYEPQTRPEKEVSEEEIGRIKNSFITIIDTLQTDYDGGIFSNFKSFSVPFGLEICNIDEAINFMLLHEGLHVGYIMAMKHALK